MKPGIAILLSYITLSLFMISIDLPGLALFALIGGCCLGWIVNNG